MGDGAGKFFESVQSGKIAADGRVIMADGGLLEIRMYNATGERIARIGREGSGPGEFRSINGLWLQPDGQMLVWDAGNQRISSFDATGELEQSRQINLDSRLPANPEVFFGSFSNGDALLAALSFGKRESRDQVVPDDWTIARFTPGGELRDTLGTLPGFWRTQFTPIPFTPVPHLVVRADSLWITAPHAAAIEIVDERGVVARTIALPWLPPFGGDVDRAWASLHDQLLRRNKSVQLEMLERVPRSDRFPRIGAMMLNEVTGAVWLKAYDPATDALWLHSHSMRSPFGGEWSILDAEGTRVATFEVPADVAVLAVRGTKLLGAVRDPLDVERVVLYDILH